MTIIKKLGLGTGLGIAALALVFVAGPRVDTRFSPKPISLPADLDAYLAAAEATVAGVTPGAEKTIRWAHSDQRRTPLALVYLHGFSATRQETAPLCDRVAASLGANVFYTRLTGHGLPGPAMATASINDWLNDAREALAIGAHIGERVVIIGTSTGATLATWLAQQPGTEAVVAYVMVSPNFGPQDRRTAILTLPWARQFVPRLVGPEIASEPISAEHAKYWTMRYPSIALIPMMGLVELTRDSTLEAITTPTLFIYSPGDRVLNVANVEAAFARLGATHKRIVPVPLAGKMDTHVIAGDIRSPDGTERIAETILEFLRGLPPASSQPD